MLNLRSQLFVLNEFTLFTNGVILPNIAQQKAQPSCSSSQIIPFRKRGLEFTLLITGTKYLPRGNGGRRICSGSVLHGGEGMVRFMATYGHANGSARLLVHVLLHEKKEGSGWDWTRL